MQPRLALLPVCPRYPERVVKEDLRVLREENARAIRAARAAEAEAIDGGGYDTVVAPPGSTVGHDGRRVRVFTTPPLRGGPGEILKKQNWTVGEAVARMDTHDREMTKKIARRAMRLQGGGGGGGGSRDGKRCVECGRGGGSHGLHGRSRCCLDTAGMRWLGDPAPSMAGMLSSNDQLPRVSRAA